MIGNLYGATADSRPPRPDSNPLEVFHWVYRRSIVAELALQHQCIEVTQLLRQETSEGVHAFFALRERVGETEAFVDDVRIALACAAHLALTPARLGAECQHAMTLASLSSLGGGFGPALLARLVTEGAWSTPQALALAQRIPAPQERARALIALLPTLEDEVATAVVATVLTAITELTGPAERAGLVVSLLDVLPRDAGLLRHVLSQMLPSLPVDEAWKVLAAAAPSMNDDLLCQSVTMATKMRAPYHVRGALASRVTEPEREAVAADMLAELRDEDELLRLAGGYVALAHLLAPEHPAVADMAAPVIDRATEAINNEVNKWVIQGVMALETVLPLQPPDQQRNILDVLRRSTAPHWVSDGLSTLLASRVDATVVRELVAWARERHPDNQVLLIEHLARIAPHAPVPVRNELIAEVVADLTGRASSGAVLWAADELDHVAPFLTDAQLDAAVAIARTVPTPDARVRALVRLASAEAGHRDELAQEALHITARIPEPEERVALLDQMAPVLRGELLACAAATARAIRDEAEAVTHLPALFTAMSADGRHRAWHWAMQATVEPIDESRRIALLDQLAAYIPAHTHAEIVGLAETTANEQLRARVLTVSGSLSAALRTARTLKPAWRCVELIHLALRSGPAGCAALLAEAASVAAEVEDLDRRVWLLRRLASASSGADRDRHVLAALASPLRESAGDSVIPSFADLMSIDIARGLLVDVSWSWRHARATVEDIDVGFTLSDHGRAEAVAALLRRCATEDDDRWLDTFLARRQSSHLAWEMAEVASGLPDDRAGDYVNRAVDLLDAEPLTIAASPPDAWWSSKTYRWVRNPGEAYDYVLGLITERIARLDAEAALPLVHRIHEPRWRLRILATLCTADATPDLATRAMDAALEVAQPELAAGLSHLATVLAACHTSVSEPTRVMLIEFVATRPRGEGFAAIFSAGPLWARWGGGEQAADEVFDSVARVTRWWP